jgi:hypothetical protein
LPSEASNQAASEAFPEILGVGHELFFETSDIAVEQPADLPSMIFIPKHLKIQSNCQTPFKQRSPGLELPTRKTIKPPNPSGKVEKHQSDGVINGALTKKINSPTGSGTPSIGVSTGRETWRFC